MSMLCLNVDEFMGIVEYLSITEFLACVVTCRRLYMLQLHRVAFNAGTLIWSPGGVYVPVLTPKNVSILRRWLLTQSSIIGGGSSVKSMQLITKDHQSIVALFSEPFRSWIDHSSLEYLSVVCTRYHDVSGVNWSPLIDFVQSSQLSQIRELNIDIGNIQLSSSLLPTLHSIAPQLESISCFDNFSNEDISYFVAGNSRWSAMRTINIGNLYARCELMDWPNERGDNLAAMRVIAVALTLNKFPSLSELNIRLSGYDLILQWLRMIYDEYYGDIVLGHAISDQTPVFVGNNIAKVCIDAEGIRPRIHWENLVEWREFYCACEGARFQGFFPNLSSLNINNWLPSHYLLPLLLGTLNIDPDLETRRLSIRLCPDADDPAAAKLFSVLNHSTLSTIKCLMICSREHRPSNHALDSIDCKSKIELVDDLSLSPNYINQYHPFHSSVVYRDLDDADEDQLGFQNCTCREFFAVPMELSSRKAERNDVFRALIDGIRSDRFAYLEDFVFEASLASFLTKMLKYTNTDIIETLGHCPRLKRIVVRVIYLTRSIVEALSQLMICTMGNEYLSGTNRFAVSSPWASETENCSTSGIGFSSSVLIQLQLHCITANIRRHLISAMSTELTKIVPASLKSFLECVCTVEFHP